MKILFLGDFLYDYNTINEDIKKLGEYIKNNKLITVLNLEAPLKSNQKAKKMINLFCTDMLIDILKILNVKAVNLANNHIMDWEEEGLIKTIKALDKANIGYFGAGLNLNEALKSYVLKDQKKTIALYGFGWNMEECINATKNDSGTAPLNFSLIFENLNKDKNDYIIPLFHFGYEYEKLPQPYHLKMCRKIKDNKKIKAIIGHHPHVVQAYEKKHNIFYSLGNFYFGTMRKNYKTKPQYSEEVNEGIGVVLDTENWKTSIVTIISNGDETFIDNDYVVSNLVDISNIKICDYQKYFYKNNNIINKKYIYKIGFWNEHIFNKTHFLRRKTEKFYLRKIKWPLYRNIKKIFNLKERSY